MAGRKISELPQKQFSGEIIDNCFYVENPYDPVHFVKMSEVFNWIKEKSMCDDGLIVEFTGDNIIFIKGKKPVKLDL